MNLRYLPLLAAQATIGILCLILAVPGLWVMSGEGLVVLAWTAVGSVTGATLLWLLRLPAWPLLLSGFGTLLIGVRAFGLSPLLPGPEGCTTSVGPYSLESTFLPSATWCVGEEGISLYANEPWSVVLGSVLSLAVVAIPLIALVTTVRTARAAVRPVEVPESRAIRRAL